MKHIFIVNPTAGQGKYQGKIVNKIKSVCEKGGYSYAIFYTNGPGAAERIAAKYPQKEYARFYAVGGDGTFNEMINGIMARGQGEAALIPCGTGDDFVRIFQDKAPFLDIEKQLMGSARSIDLLSVGSRYAANLCNLGIDAETAADVHRFSKFLPGPLAYSVALIWRLFHPLGIEMTVTLDDAETFRGTYLLASFANGRAYGGGYCAAPKARFDDGWMEICLVKPISRLRFSRLLNQYKTGKHLDNEDFRPILYYRRAKKVVFHTIEEHRFCIDGEIIATNHGTIELCPNALLFSVPLGAVLQK